MVYFTLDELKTLVPNYVMLELSNDNPSIEQGEIDVALVTAIIGEACEEVDGYLRNRYTLPFATTPTLVKQSAKQIARYMLYERRPEGFDLPPAVVEGRKVAVKNLENIRDGKVSIGIPANMPNQGQIVADVPEFQVRVRPSRNNQSVFNNNLLDSY